MKNFQEQVEAARKLSRALHSFDIDLALWQTDKEYAIAGNFFYVLHTPELTDYINIRFNEISNPSLKLELGLGFRSYYERVFITTPGGQTGSMTIFHGLVDPEQFAIIDNRTQAGWLVLESILKQLRGVIGAERSAQVAYGGATVSLTAVELIATKDTRVGCTIQADATNTGIIYLGFSNIVSSTIYFRELAAGQVWESNNYTGPVWGIASIASQKTVNGRW